MCKNYVVDVKVGKGGIQTHVRPCNNNMASPLNPAIRKSRASPLYSYCGQRITLYFVIYFMTLPVSQSICIASYNRVIVC
jgi:hypothetical protein